MSKKLIHIALGVSNIEDSVKEYNKRLGCSPDVVIDGEYALWRTDAANFSIRQSDEVGLRHLGFEEDVKDFKEETDCNGILWESFSQKVQREEILELWPDAKFLN